MIMELVLELLLLFHFQPHTKCWPLRGGSYPIMSSTSEEYGPTSGFGPPPVGTFRVRSSTRLHFQITPHLPHIFHIPLFHPLCIYGVLGDSYRTPTGVHRPWSNTWIHKQSYFVYILFIHAWHKEDREMLLTRDLWLHAETLSALSSDDPPSAYPRVK